MERVRDQRELTAGRSVMLAIMAATLTFGKQVAFLLVEENRYFFLWRFKDTAGVIVDMLIFMAVLVAVTLLCRRWVWGERLWNRVLVIMITSGIITLFPTWLLPPISVNATACGWWCLPPARCRCSGGACRSCPPSRSAR